MYACISTLDENKCVINSSCVLGFFRCILLAVPFFYICALLWVNVTPNTLFQTYNNNNSWVWVMTFSHYLSILIWISTYSLFLFLDSLFSYRCHTKIIIFWAFFNNIRGDIWFFFQKFIIKITKLKHINF